MGFGQAQDVIYSQAFFSAQRLNPALTGETFENRALLQYRNQWPSIPGGVVATGFSLDRSLPLINSGAGIYIQNTQAGVGGLSATSVAINYSYRLDFSRKLAFRAGTEIGYSHRSVNFYSLTFPDQLGPDGPLGQLSNENYSNLGNTGFLDLGLGGVLFSPKAWIGLSTAHINRPDQSFFKDQSERLPIRYIFHAGYKIDLQPKQGLIGQVDEMSLSPQLIFRTQGPFSQLDVGAVLRLEPFWTGVFYRGLPLRSNYGLFNQDALVFMAGLQQKEYVFGYSYDVTLSLLSAAAGGAHELTFIYQFSLIKQGKRRKLRPRQQIGISYPGI